MTLYELINNTFVQGSRINVYVLNEETDTRLVASLKDVEDLAGYEEIEPYEDYTVRYIYCKNNALAIELVKT